MIKVSALQPRCREFEHHTGQDYDSSYDTSTGWFGQETLNKLCENLLHNTAKVKSLNLNNSGWYDSIYYIDYYMRTLINMHMSDCNVKLVLPGRSFI